MLASGCGAPLAQVAERRAFNPGVGGSSPSRRTKPPSSRGLGYRPFKAETRIRIPLGAPLSVAWAPLAISDGVLPPLAAKPHPREAQRYFQPVKMEPQVPFLARDSQNAAANMWWMKKAMKNHISR